MLELKNQDPGIGILSYPKTGVQQVLIVFLLHSNESFFLYFLQLENKE